MYVAGGLFFFSCTCAEKAARDASWLWSLSHPAHFDFGTKGDDEFIHHYFLRYMKR